MPGMPGDSRAELRESSLVLSQSSGDELTSLKRKRETKLDESSRRTSKRKRAKKSKATLDDDIDIDVKNGVNLALGHLDPQLLADHIAKQTKRFADDLTLIELEESRIPLKAILNTTEYARDRVIGNLSDFLEHYSSKRNGITRMSEAPKQNGSPHTLVITSSGIRAAELTRALRIFQTKDAVVAKLFAKHIKLAKAIEDAQRTRMCIGVGTPSRISDLMNKGALSSKNLLRIVIDSSHIDQKKRGILDMKDTQQALMKLLNNDELRPRYAQDSGSIELLFY